MGEAGTCSAYHCSYKCYTCINTDLNSRPFNILVGFLSSVLNTVIIMKSEIRTSLFILSILMLFFSIGEVSAEYSIDEIISSAANSSEEFAFIRNGEDFFIKTELDMLFTKEQWNERALMNETSTRKKRKAIRRTNYRWTNKIVPYQIYGYFSQRDRQQITLAINEWNQYTCIRLRPAGSRDRNRITIQNGGGCSSFVGMRGGSQPVSLAPNCRIKKIIVHELGHAIGFQHEQTRSDRDSYVYILRQNIPGSMYYNFQKFSPSFVNNHNVPYDYTSVMHYGAYAFSYNGQRTIQTKNAKYQNIIGKAPGLSFRDIKLANLMYSCGSHCGGKSCPSPGYLDKNCQCMCPGPSANQPIRKCSGGGGGGGKDCVDQNSNCRSWAANGECTKNPSYMLTQCKKSCKKCGGGGGGGGGENKGDCVDKNSKCANWASRGECEINPDYMHINCKKSCKKCGQSTNCVDMNRHCSVWASIGECKKNPRYMLVSCKKSCQACSSSSVAESIVLPTELRCIDEYSQCPTWSRHGECQKNPNFMLQYCKKSCKYCKGATDGSASRCIDYNPLCPLWLRIGECQRNPAYMMTSCRKSCGVCSPDLEKKDVPCFDFHNQCSQWKTEGLCTKPVYKFYMTTNCPLSCGVCS